MAQPSVEERLSALETELAELKRQLSGSRPGVIGRTRPDFLDTMVGIHAGNPLFAEFVRNIEAERERERASARREEDAATDDATLA